VAARFQARFYRARSIITRGHRRDPIYYPNLPISYSSKSARVGSGTSSAAIYQIIFVLLVIQAVFRSYNLRKAKARPANLHFIIAITCGDSGLSFCSHIKQWPCSLHSRQCNRYPIIHLITPGRPCARRRSPRADNQRQQRLSLPPPLQHLNRNSNPRCLPLHPHPHQIKTIWG
jgi:hypothetical protein